MCLQVCRKDRLNGIWSKLRLLEDYKGSVEFDGIVPLGIPLNWQADVTKLGNLGITDFLSLERGIHVYANWCYAELLGI